MTCKMRKETLLLIILKVILIFAGSCIENPGQLQCLVHNNRFILPRNKECNPLEKTCRMGDLVDKKIASCTLGYSGNILHSLTRKYRLPLYYCLPEIQSSESATSETISADLREPGCVGVKKTGKGQFTCGSKGTRCVCHAPNGILTPQKNKCRCQFFIDYCLISNVCSHPKATCLTNGNTVTCTCSPKEKSCRPGINQCTADPSVCRGQEECIELYDEFSSWVIGAKQSDDGYACVRKQDIQLLQVSTKYCSVTPFRGEIEEKALDHIDVCCYRLLVCGSEDKTIKGNILSYRPCYCGTEFRSCLLRYSKHPTYQDIANAVIRSLNQQKTCAMSEDNSCDPRKPETCQKGDLVNVKVAHCKINCKSGPLLPIGQRMCSIRQCTPANYIEGVRMIDVPNQRKSSLCQAVRSLPYLCGKGDTRCVCDSRPPGLTFTDRCRCQYWPFVI